jgi:hypothetical protein
MLFTTCVFAVVVFAGVLALGGTGLCTDGARLRERKRARDGVRYQWTTRVADVCDGYSVKLQGTALADERDLRAPFSGRHCVAFELTLFDFEGVRPVLLARETVARSFFLRDATGVAHVVPEPARIGIEPDKRWRFESPRRDPRIAAIIERHHLAAKVGEHPLVVCEGVIEIGGPVAVLGHAAHEPAPTDGNDPYRSVGMRPVVSGSPHSPLLLVADV